MCPDYVMESTVTSPDTPSPPKVRQSQKLDTRHLDLHHLLNDPLMVALPAGHRVAHRKTLRLAELAGESWIEGFPDSSQSLAEACQRAGFRPRVEFAVREWTAKQGFVAAGLGLALVPLTGKLETSAGRVSADPGLVW
jgi:DNA-binding transcriptional LysR family regulator